MTVSADTLELLMEQGITGDALLRIVRSIEADQAPAEKTRSPAAIRQARYRNRRRGITDDVTRDVTGDVTRYAPPLDKKERCPKKKLNSPREGAGPRASAHEAGTGRPDWPTHDFRTKLIEAVAPEPVADDPDFAPIAAEIAAGATESDVLAGIRQAFAKRRDGRPFRTWKALAGWVRGEVSDRKANRRTTEAIPAAPEGPMVRLVDGRQFSAAGIRKTWGEGRWFVATMGPRPGEPGCLVPAWVWETPKAAGRAPRRNPAFQALDAFIAEKREGQVSGRDPFTLAT